MAKKPRRKKVGSRKPVMAKTRASDDELRERLRNFDPAVLDSALAKAVKRT
jgi:hypothetical protein